MEKRMDDPAYGRAKEVAEKMEAVRKVAEKKAAASLGAKMAISTGKNSYTKGRIVEARVIDIELSQSVITAVFEVKLQYAPDSNVKGPFRVVQIPSA
jgi:hypothetical protein